MTGWSRAGTAGEGRHLMVAALAAALLVPGLALAAVRASAPRPRLTVKATPAQATVTAGATVRFVLAVSQRGRRRTLRLRVGSRLPAGATAGFSPAVVRARLARVVLRVRTAARTPAGTYRLRIASATVTLTVAVAKTPPPLGAIGISGDAPGPLAPGLAQPLDVSLHNPYSFDVVVQSVAVEVAGVEAPNATAAHGCSPADFATAPLRAPGGVTLRTGTTATLDALGVPASQWPRVEMLDLPADQDGCQHALLQLGYSGSGVKASG